ncbi:MAG TPA: hypothetical protein DCZ75_11285 [Geobacter sp.]|nr:hypothetical protein [Geobacter sp.]
MKIRCIYLLACVSFVLSAVIARTSDGAEEDFSTKRFCFDVIDYTSLYTDAELSLQLSIEDKKCIYIEAKVDNKYKIVTDDKVAGYTTGDSIKHLIKYKFGRLVSDYEYKDRLIKLEVERVSKSKERARLRRTLERIGISKGKELWVKQKIDSLVPFQTVEFCDADFTSDYTIELELKSGEDVVYVDTLATHKDITKKINQIFYKSSPYKMWTKKINKHIEEGKIFIGMSAEQVVASWGEPDDMNRSVGKWGVHEQWVYRGANTYLYFENDKLTSFQD